MSRGQRLTFLGIAAIIAVVAVIVLSGGGDETEKAADATATPSREVDAMATPTRTPPPKPKPPLLLGGRERTLSFDQGDTVRFRVRHGEAEEVHIHGYDIKKDVKAGETEQVSFKATIDGIFEIEFENSAKQIAELRVDP